MSEHIQDLLNFLDASPTAVQASEQAVARLRVSGFRELDEASAWKLRSGGKYFVRRQNTVLALVTGSQPLTKTGFQLAAAHLDSPGLKLKPDSLKTEGGISRVAVEVYGGPILSTWTDRELGIAGLAAVRTKTGHELRSVDLGRPAAVIPNAAIHLNREVNKGFEYNKQTHLQALLTAPAGSANPLLAAVAGALKVKPEQLGQLELFLYDRAKAALAGLDGKLVVSGRLDNLGMSHAILSSICRVEKPRATCLAVLYDHEEIGSQTAQGAYSSLLAEILERVGLALGFSREEQIIARRKSFMISGDMAHAYHPSYPEKYEPSSAPVMNGGPAIKWHAGYSYASTVDSSQRFASLCEQAQVKPQKFVMRSDLICGHTVGPIVAAQLGIPVVDVGNPLWAMHSVRETAGVDDHLAMIRVLDMYYQ